MKGFKKFPSPKAPGISKKGQPKVKGTVPSGYMQKSLRQNLKRIRGKGR